VADFVLVHGGGHGAWCWERLTPLLREAGHRVFTPVLTGVGERAAELTAETSLSTHITDVCQLIDSEDLTGFMLVGHSYGGTVITGVADRMAARIAQLIYLDAPQPGHGQSMVDASPGAADALALQKRTVDGIDLVLFPTPEVIGYFGLTDPADIAWAIPHLTPHPLRSFQEKLDLADPAAVAALPHASIDIPDRHAERLREPLPAGAGPRRLEVIETGHDMMISEPRKLADLLLDIAAQK